MRTVSSTITAAEIGAVLAPIHAATVRNELLSFAVPTLNTNADVETGVPQSYAYNAAGTHVYAAFREADGDSSLVVFAPGTATNWSLSQSAAAIAPYTTMHAMRAGLLVESGTVYVYSAIPDGSQIQVRRSEVSDTTNPPSLSFADFGPAFGAALTDTSSLVRRVEAVCPTSGGVVAAVGEHDFANNLSTVTFWLVSSTGAVQLNAIIQDSLDEAYSAWYDCALWATRICALYDSATETLWVFAPRDRDGRTATFGIRTGIESHLAMVLPVDVESSAAIFSASSASTINSVHYLAGRLTRAMSDGSTLAFDCYLTSADGERWSLGERSFYIQSGDATGTLLLDPANHIVYYGGNLYANSADATMLQDSGAASQSAALSAIAGWSVQQISDGADSMTLSLARGNALLTSDPLVKPGAVLYLQTGQGATLADFGAYGVDKASAGATSAGGKAPSISARDIAGKRLSDWRAMCDLVMRGRHSCGLSGSAALARLEHLIVKSPAVGYEATSGGLLLDGLNEPFVAYLDYPNAGDGAGAAASGDGLTKLTVRHSVDDDYRLSSIGVLIGAGDDGTGNVCLIPLANAWTGHTQTKAAVRRMSLAAVDPDDPTAPGTGWLFTRRVDSLWESVVSSARTSAAAGSYATDTAPGMAADTEYDIAVRVAGRRAQVFVKERDLSPEHCAEHAGYTLVSEFMFSYQCRKLQGGKSYTGIALGTDVFVDTQAFAHSVYDDVELGLTVAQDLTTGAGSVAALFSGVFSVSSYGDQNYVTAGSGADLSEFAAGQHIRIYQNTLGGTYHGVVALVDATGFFVSPSPHGLGSDDNCAVYLRSGDAFGSCDSAARDYTEYGGAKRVQDPRAVKTALLLYGVGAVMSNDNTAHTRRYWKSDGVVHRMVDTGWDATWPGGAGTDPAAWKFIFHHNAIAQVWLSEEHDLPTAGYLLVDDEVVRYAEVSFGRFDENQGDPYANTAYWTIIPTYYTVAAEQTAVDDDIVNAWISGHVVGEAFDSSDIVAGMLVELSARSSPAGFRLPDTTQPAPWYIVSKAGSGSSASIKVGTYDAAFGTLSAYVPDILVRQNDLVICSGRGQFGTGKAGHSPTAPVVYYPHSASGAPASILVSRYEHHSGLCQTMEDAIRSICALAGQRSVTMRTAHTTPTAGVSQAITTTPYSLPLREDLADFVLDMIAHVPAYGNLLNIEFRGYYKLCLAQTSTSGVVRIGLATTSTDVGDANASDKWLEWVEVPMGGIDIASAATANTQIRLAIHGDLVVVELGRQHAWTFNLASLTDGTNSYRSDSAGDVTVYYTSSVSGNAATMRVHELSALVDEAIIRRGDNARGAIDGIAAGYHVRSRATAAGGIEFSQFWARVYAGGLDNNMLSDDWAQTDLQQAGHLQMTGAGVSGEALDEAAVRAGGYAYDARDNQALATAADCVIEARLSVREGLEYAGQRQVTGYGRIAPQPEDVITLTYEPSGGAPQHAESSHIITSITLTASPAAVRGTYVLRDDAGEP